jgi:hypothetical protein
MATRRTLLSFMLCLLVCSIAALAADRGPRGATTQASSVIHRQADNDDVVAPVKIYSNLGPADDLYDGLDGYFVGNNPGEGVKQDIAIPFIPAQDSTVTRVKLALQYYGIGTNGALVAIYDDDDGLPGRILAKKQRGNFEDFGDGCCDLVLWTLGTPLPVKAGTQYWIVGTSNKKSKDSVNTWDWTFDEAPARLAYQWDDAGWILLNASFGYTGSAVAVRGTIP